MHTFTHNTMSSLLHLQGVIIYKVTETEESFEIKIGQPRKPTKCPHCSSRNIIKHGAGRNRTLRHGINIGGKTIFLKWKSKRFKCKGCKKTWSVKPPSHLVEDKQQSTKYCRQQAIRTLQTNSYRTTRKQTGLSYRILRDELHKVMSTRPLLKIPEGKLSLGIDEHGRAKGKLATTVTLVKPHRQLLGLIPKATSVELVRWVKNSMTYSQRIRVKEISMDMTKCLRKQLKQLFPRAKFVMDHFHIIAYLNQLIAKEYRFMIQHGNLSKEEKDKLPARTKGLGVVKLLYQGGQYWTEKDKDKIRAVFKVIPRVAELWYAKEEVRAIYQESLCKQEARERWQYVLTLMPEVAKRTFTEKLEEILNYFDNRTTSGFTEGVHTKVKLLKRLSYGFRNPQSYVEKLELGFVEPKLLISNHTN